MRRVIKRQRHQGTPLCMEHSQNSAQTSSNIWQICLKGRSSNLSIYIQWQDISNLYFFLKFIFSAISQLDILIFLHLCFIFLTPKVPNIFEQEFVFCEWTFLYWGSQMWSKRGSGNFYFFGGGDWILALLCRCLQQPHPLIPSGCVDLIWPQFFSICVPCGPAVIPWLFPFTFSLHPM